MWNIQLAHRAVQTDKVCLANLNERAAAEAFMARKYAECGYGEDHKLPAGCDTFVVFSEGRLAGTLSLSMDGSHGLPSDKIFRQELDRFRAGGARLCELTRFVFDLKSPSPTILSKLFAEIHRHGLQHYDCTDLIIAADPRHRRFYQHKWNFECVGPPKMNTVFGIKSQLMRVPVAAIAHAKDRPARSSVHLAFTPVRNASRVIQSPPVPTTRPISLRGSEARAECSA
jgi:hypothetical protein